MIPEELLVWDVSFMLRIFDGKGKKAVGGKNQMFNLAKVDVYVLLVKVVQKAKRRNESKHKQHQ